MFFLILFSSGKKKQETLRLNISCFLKVSMDSFFFQSFILRSYFKDRKINYDYSSYKMEGKKGLLQHIQNTGSGLFKTFSQYSYIHNDTMQK